MPLIEYGCYDCKKISEALIRDRYNIPESAPCEHCEGENTVRLISRVNYKLQKKAKYDDDFLGKAMAGDDEEERDGGVLCRRTPRFRRGEDVRDGGADRDPHRPDD